MGFEPTTPNLGVVHHHPAISVGIPAPSEFASPANSTMIRSVRLNAIGPPFLPPCSIADNLR
jgi:hypothetical protein